VLMVIALPFAAPESIGCVGTTWIGILVLGVAYVLGTVADKAADTILGGPEQLMRLRVASQSKSVDDKSVHDPFPQDRIEANLIWKGGESSIERANYLRTRIRMTRTLAVFALPAGLSFGYWLGVISSNEPAVIQLSVSPGCHIDFLKSPSARVAWIPAAVIVFTVVIAVLLKPMGDRYHRHFVPPHTTTIAANPTSQWKSESRRWWWQAYIAPLAELVLSVLCATLLWKVARNTWLSPPAVGLFISLSGLWAWLRILKTYFNFLEIQHSLDKEKTADSRFPGYPFD